MNLKNKGVLICYSHFYESGPESQPWGKKEGISFSFDSIKKRVKWGIIKILPLLRWSLTSGKEIRMCLKSLPERSDMLTAHRFPARWLQGRDSVAMPRGAGKELPITHVHPSSVNGGREVRLSPQ